MLELLRTINNDYSALLTLVSSIIMIIVTIVYVNQTMKQAKYAKESAELVAKQIKIDKQPCVIPEIVDSHGSAFDAGDYTRIQLGFKVTLKNIGDSPALNLFTVGEIELQFTQDSSGNLKRLPASLQPIFVQALGSGEQKEIILTFETNEIKQMMKDLQIAMDKNWDRIKNDPTRSAYNGAKIIVHVFSKNIMGQWSESVLSHDIAWLNYSNPPKQRTHNINENTLPPRKIKKGDQFSATIVSPKYAPFSFQLQSEDYVKNMLQKNTDEKELLSQVLEYSQMG